MGFYGILWVSGGKCRISAASCAQLRPPFVGCSSALKPVDNSVTLRLGRESVSFELGKLREERVEIAARVFPELGRVEQVGVGDDCRTALSHSAARNKAI